MNRGKMQDASWKRGANIDHLHIVDNSGNSLFVPKGKPWISLVPGKYSPSFDN